MMWPKRRKSDLVVRPGAQYGMGPYTQKRAQKVPEAPAPTSVPIRIIRSRTPSAPQDPMWPRRKKSDLMIYQETRIPKKSDADLFWSGSRELSCCNIIFICISLILRTIFLCSWKTLFLKVGRWPFLIEVLQHPESFSKKCDFVQIYNSLQQKCNFHF